MFALINNILAVILFIITVVIVVKKVFMGVKGTDSGVINITIALLGVVAALCCLCIFIGANRIESLTAMINSGKSMSPADIAEFKRDLAETKHSNIVSLIVGYSTLIFDFILYKVIETKDKKERAQVKSHWDWKKIN